MNIQAIGWFTLLECARLLCQRRHRLTLRGIDAALIGGCLRVLLRRGFELCEISWILDDNALMRRIGEMFGGTIYKTYALYEGSA